MYLKTLVDRLPKPCMILIEGARESGKDVTAHQTCRILTYRQAQPKKIIYINIDPKKYNLPSYFKKWDHKFHNNSILYLTDAHLEYYSTEWATKKAVTLTKLQNISRHKNIDMVWTTLLATDVPKNFVRRLDASIYKEPVFRAEKFERVELREEIIEAREFFEPLNKQEKWQSALVFTQKGKYAVYGIQKPFYWSEELSKAHAGLILEKPKQPTTIVRI